MAENTVQAGAAYEAVLNDKVSGKVEKIVASLERLEAAFKGVAAPAQSLNRSIGGVATVMGRAGKQINSSATMMQTLGKRSAQASLLVSRASQSIGQSMIHIGQQIRNTGAVMTGFSTAVGFGLKSAVDEFSASEETLQAFTATFGENTEEMRKWAANWANVLGRTERAAQEGLIEFQAFFTGMGVGADEANELSKQMLRLAVDMAQFRNRADKEFIKRFRGGLSGESENLKGFGFAIQEADLKLEALGKTGKVLTRLEKTKFIFQIITRRMEEMGAAGAALRERMQFSSLVKQLSAAFANLKKNIGRSVVGRAAELVGTLKSLAKTLEAITTDQVNKLISAAVAIGVLGTAFLALGTALTLAGPPIIAAGTIIAAMFAGLAAAIAAGPIGLAVGAVALLAGALTGIFTFFMVREFPLMLAIEELSRLFGTLDVVIQAAMQGLAAALATGQFEDIWRIFTLSGEIAFRQMGLTLTAILKQAIINGIAGGVRFAFELGLDALMPFVPADFEGLFGRGGLTNREEEELAISNLIAELQILADLLSAGVPEGGGFFDEFNKFFEEAFGSGGKGKGVLNQASSIGAFGGFGTDIGDFAPIMNPVQRNQEKQIALAQEQIDATKETTEAVREIEEAEFR